jgi:hypothetical protein
MLGLMVGLIRLPGKNGLLDGGGERKATVEI